MNAAEKQAVLAAYYSARESYHTLAREIRRLFDSDIDPTVPAECIYTITHRLKDEDRLIEKLERDADGTSISPENYAGRCTDILGMRIVCLRLADVDRLEGFVESLRDSRRLKIHKGPERKRTFVLQVDPREDLPRDIDLQYTGYSSVHYVVGLGESLQPTELLGGLRAELQVRTLLEEAWGEIDHKYRYELVRGGTMLPDLLNRGFYSFAAYLQAAALQAEYLCIEAERVIAEAAVPEPVTKSRRQLASGLPVTGIRDALHSTLGFVPERRTVNYVARRLRDYKMSESDLPKLKSEILSPKVLGHFRQIYEEVTGRQPFAEPKDRDVDLINALNFGLVRSRQADSVAAAGARDVIARRFRKRLPLWELVFRDSDEAPLTVESEVNFEPGTRVSLADGTSWRVAEVELKEAGQYGGRVWLERVER